MRQYRRPKRLVPDAKAPEVVEEALVSRDDLLARKLLENEAQLRQHFENSGDIVFRRFSAAEGQPPQREVEMLAVYVDGLVDTKHLDKSVLNVLMKQPLPQSQSVTVAWVRDKLVEHALPISQVEIVTKMVAVLENILKGNVVLFVDGDEAALSAEVKGWERRSIEEPPSEPVIRGPREGFIETLRTNTAMIRRRLRSTRLKLENFAIGELSKTDVAIMYIDGVVSQDVLDEVRTRLQRIKIDAVLESAFIEEFIEDQPRSPFPQLQNTERPDVVCSALLEGRVAIFTDGTPFVLMAPGLFWGALNANEDYYERMFMSSFLRMLRIAFMMMSLLLPSLYVAMTTFQQEMIPTNLLLSIAAAREATPFPAVIEALFMEITFEALREAGVRMPKQIGQAMSIVGALVIGQAAVQAGIISAPMVIVVSLTGIASFTFPRYNVGISIRLLRFPMLILAGMFGVYGIAIGLFLLVIHLVSLRSFGLPYFTPVAPTKFSDLKDVFIRVPRWAMYRRQLATTGSDTVRVPYGQRPRPQRGSKKTDGGS